MSAPAVRERHALAERLGIDPSKLELLRGQLAPNAPDDVLELYFERCRLAGADPFARMFYASSRNIKERDGSYSARWTIETTIDGFRSIAEATGEYDGQDAPVEVLDAQGNLVATTVTVHRKGMARGVSATARFDEYVQLIRDGSPGPMWRKMPHAMLAKCAEALALRKAFPRQLSGLYTNDEMEQSANPERARPLQSVAANPPAALSSGDEPADPLHDKRKRAADLCKQRGYDRAHVEKMLTREYNKATLRQLNEAQLGILIDQLTAALEADAKLSDEIPL